MRGRRHLHHAKSRASQRRVNMLEMILSGKPRRGRECASAYAALRYLLIADDMPTLMLRAVAVALRKIFRVSLAVAA